MSNNMLNLLSKFTNIVNQGWVKGTNNNKNSVGLTFEYLLGKEVDSDFFPDYRDIEIKCSQRYSYFPIHLFDKAFDGPYLFETNVILEKYGTKYNFIFDKKYLKVKFKVDEDVLVNDKYLFRLNVLDSDERIYFDIYNKDKELLDRPFINFYTIKNHLLIKLSNLAFIYASKKEIAYSKYFRYYSISFFKLKRFETNVSAIP